MKTFLAWLESLQIPWRNERDEKQFQIDPPDINQLYHVTTDRNMLNNGGAASTSSYGRQGFHVFDNLEDAEWYYGSLIRRGHINPEILKVQIPIEDLKPDREHMGRAYIARDFKPEYLVKPNV